VIGVAADGVTRFVVRVSGLPGPGTVQLQLLDEVGGTDGVGTLRTPGDSEDVTTLDVPVTMLPDGRAMALAVYVAPDDFIRGLNDTMIGVRVVNLGIAYQPFGAGSLVLAYSPLGTAFSDKPPFDVSFEVPPEAIGASVVNAFAFDANWNMAVADPIAVQVEVAAVLTGIDIDPQEVFLFSFGPDYQLRVTGHYDDGIDREITDAALGTVYESLDPGIVTVDVDGIVTAVSVGTATVQAANGAQTATAPVEVVNLTCQGDIDQDGVVTVADFLFLLAAWGLAESPADIVDPAGVGIEDFLTLLANWGPCPSQ
jgi:hypothetical protein